MAKIKKISLFIVSLILLIAISNIVNAVDVGIVVEFEDGTVKTDCVNTPIEADGFAILEKSVFDVLWSSKPYIDLLFGISYGHSLCKINGEGTEINSFGTGCEYFGDFWNFNILPDGDNEWIHSPVGHNGDGGCWNRKITSFGGHYCGVDKDVIGYKFASGVLGNGEPKLKTYADVCEKLEVKDIAVYVDGKKEAGADESGGKIDVIPGSKVELKVEIKNLYSDDEDVEIEEISIEGTLEGIDNGNDIEAAAKDFDLSAGKDKEITLEFNIPLEVEDSNYDLTVEIEGENERGFSYSKIIEFEVEAEKEKHDVVFNRLEFSNNNIECGNAAKLNVDAVNLGTNDEDVKLMIANSDLGIDIKESFKLSEDPFGKENSFRRSYTIELPQSAIPGEYIFIADLFFGSDAERSTAALNVECGNFEAAEKSESIIFQVAGSVPGVVLQSKAQEPSQEKNVENENSLNNPVIISLMVFSAITFISIIALLLYLLKI